MSTRTVRTRLVEGWALTGVVLLFGSAIYRLGRRGVATVQAGLDGMETVALLLLVVAFVYGEGVRAIQKRYAPHLVGRIRAAGEEPWWVYRFLAPFYAMSLVGAPRASMARAWAGVSAIVGAILLLRLTPEPWRGIVDVAVALALAWGLGAILVRAWRDGVGRGR